MNGRSIIGILFAAALVFGQNEQSYKSTNDSVGGGFLDPSRFSIHHSLSFGMGAAGGSSLQSQSLYSTMLTYRFSQPVTLNLNFGFPLFSTFSSTQNLTAQNIRSGIFQKHAHRRVALMEADRQHVLPAQFHPRAVLILFRLLFAVLLLSRQQERSGNARERRPGPLISPRYGSRPLSFLSMESPTFCHSSAVFIAWP